MAKTRTYPIGTRHKLNQEVDKSNYFMVASNIKATGHKTVTDFLDAIFEKHARKLRLEGYTNENGSGEKQ